MREFILLALKAKTSPDFSLKDLPKAGRLDVVCRAIANTLWVSQGIREDTVLHVILNGPKHPPKIIRFEGKEIVGFAFDEQGIAAIIKEALGAGIRLGLDDEVKVREGIYIRKESFESLVRRKSEEKPIYYLHKKGDDIRRSELPEDLVFIYGDIRGLPKNTERFLKNLKIHKVKLSPVMLFASHCPILVHNELDRKRHGWD